MIVLDEQLLGRSLEIEIARWYPGSVLFITDLRPNSVIKDDGIAKLLQEQNQPTFVTINEIDFWHKIAISRHFCVACFTLTDARAIEIPTRLRSLLQHQLFAAKQQRMGHVIRLTEQQGNYYRFDNKRVKSFSLS